MTDEQLEEAIERGKHVASAYGLALRSKTRRAIEHGVAAYESAVKLAEAFVRLKRFLDASDYSNPGEIDAALDMWWIYLHRQIEATVRFLDEAGAVLGGGREHRQLVREAKEWKKARTDAVARGRQEAAHGNPVFVSGIADEGLWEPMIVHGAAYAPALEEMIKPRPDALKRRLELWGPGIERVMHLALAEGDQLCRRLASNRS